MVNQGRVEPFWHSDEEGTLSAVWYRGTKGITRPAAGVLVLQGIGPDEAAVSQGIKAIGVAVANLGFLTLSIEFAGNGQSPESLDQAAIHHRWQRQITAAVRFLRKGGATWVAVIAPRLAGGLAVLAGQETPMDALVLWSPVLSGKRYIRELKMLQATASEDMAQVGELAVGDYIFPPGLAECVAQIDATQAAAAPAASVLYIEGPNRNINEAMIAKLRDQKVHVTVESSPDTDSWLFVPTHKSRPPIDSASAVANWLESACPRCIDEEAKPSDLPLRSPTHLLVHRGHKVRETFVSVGTPNMNGVYSEPIELEARKLAVLFISMGPGRSFVAAARHLATLGYRSLRFDFSGLGLSPLRPGEKVPKLYHQIGRDDVKEATEYLRQKGIGEIAVVGFCAGAWASFSSPPLPGVVGMAAINVYLSIRDRSTFLEEASRRSGLFGRLAQLLFRVNRRLSRSILLAGLAIRWLRAHQKAGVKLGLFYDADDFSYQYWDKVLARTFRKEVKQASVQVRTYKNLGHLANGRAARAEMMEDIEAFIADCE